MPRVFDGSMQFRVLWFGRTQPPSLTCRVQGDLDHALGAKCGGRHHAAALLLHSRLDQTEAGGLVGVLRCCFGPNIHAFFGALRNEIPQKSKIPSKAGCSTRALLTPTQHQLVKLEPLTIASCQSAVAFSARSQPASQISCPARSGVGGLL